MSKKYGYWETQGLKFESKYYALRHATIHNSEVWFKYHNEVWTAFDRSVLGKIPLNVLYRTRAQQLRDKYEYLILYYSGGADSHNVLRSFLDNSILLDEICVKMPKHILDGKYYSPNKIDLTARNYWSEWDYSIKPTLDVISQQHPNIKINIKDYIGNSTTKNIELLFEKSNHIRPAAMLYSDSVSDSDLVVSDSGKTVGHIFGTDKPLLLQKENAAYMFFNDFALSTTTSGPSNHENGECFYWAPDFPILPFEMAYQTSEYYNLNPNDRKYLKWDPVLISDRFQQDIAKKMCYTTWDNRFQVEKCHFSQSVYDDRWYWMFENNEFVTMRDAFLSNAKSCSSMIDPRFLGYTVKMDDTSVPAFKGFMTASFFIREFSNA